MVKRGWALQLGGLSRLYQASSQVFANTGGIGRYCQEWFTARIHIARRTFGLPFSCWLVYLKRFSVHIVVLHFKVLH